MQLTDVTKNERGYGLGLCPLPAGRNPDWLLTIHDFTRSLGKTAGSGSGRLAVVQPRPVLSLVANFIWFWEGPYNGPCGLSYFTRVE